MTNNATFEDLTPQIAELYGLGARLGRSVKPEDLTEDRIGKMREWKIIKKDGNLDHAALQLPLNARGDWTWVANMDPWAPNCHRDLPDLILALAMSGRGRLFLFHTGNIPGFLDWKHRIMREAVLSLVGYLSSHNYQIGSRARAACDPPMGDPDPPTKEIRRIYDGARHYAKQIGFETNGRNHWAPWIGECHWKIWPPQNVLIRGVGREWDR